MIAATDAQCSDGGGEFLRARQHVGQVGHPVGDPVDVEEDGAGDMAGLELGAGVPGIGGQEEGRVDDPHLRVAKPLGQPVGGDDGAGHCSQSGTGKFFSRRKAGLNMRLW